MTKEEIKKKVLLVVMQGAFLPESVKKEMIQDDELLEAYGMDSFAFIQLIVKLEKEFGIEVPEYLLVVDKWETVNLIVTTLYSILNDLPVL